MFSMSSAGCLSYDEEVGISVEIMGMKVNQMANQMSEEYEKNPQPKTNQIFGYSQD